MDNRGKKRTGISFIDSVRVISELQAVLWESHPSAGIPIRRQDVQGLRGMGRTEKLKLFIDLILLHYFPSYCVFLSFDTWIFPLQVQDHQILCCFHPWTALTTPPAQAKHRPGLLISFPQSIFIQCCWFSLSFCCSYALILSVVIYEYSAAKGLCNLHCYFLLKSEI